MLVFSFETTHSIEQQFTRDHIYISFLNWETPSVVSRLFRNSLKRIFVFSTSSKFNNFSLYPNTPCRARTCLDKRDMTAVAYEQLIPTLIRLAARFVTTKLKRHIYQNEYSFRCM